MIKGSYIGIDLGGTTIKYGLFNESGKGLRKTEVPTPEGRTAILGELVHAVGSLRGWAEKNSLEVQAIGIGSPGLVDPERGKIIGRSPNLVDWEGVELKKKLEKAGGLPVAVENDANVMALAEHRLGAGKGYSSGIYITVGTGIGSGIILDNRLWRGAQYAGAEIGHTIIVKDGRECPCGKRGCLEVYANAAAMILYYGKPVPPSGGVKYIFRRAERSGDRAAVHAIEEAAEHLAAGIGSALELLNPELVVIGGGVASGRSYLPAVRAKLKAYSSATALRKLKLTPARLGNDAGMIGAALMAAED